MVFWILRRLGYAVITLFLVSLLTFFIIELAPGSAEDAEIDRLRAMGSTVSVEQTAALEEQYGVNDPWIVKYGKWVLVAGSAAMNYLALEAHNDAEDSFDEVESRCFDDPSRCDLGPTGTYTDPEIEALYQTSLHYDRAARGWLIGGQTALAGAS